MDQKKIGRFLKELRKEKVITQEQLAEKIKVSGRTVSRWETGVWVIIGPSQMKPSKIKGLCLI